MITTLLTQRLGIAHPILLGPMDLVADARLTAAVSSAGVWESWAEGMAKNSG